MGRIEALVEAVSEKLDDKIVTTRNVIAQCNVGGSCSWETNGSVRHRLISGFIHSGLGVSDGDLINECIDHNLATWLPKHWDQGHMKCNLFKVTKSGEREPIGILFVDCHNQIGFIKTQWNKPEDVTWARFWRMVYGPDYIEEVGPQ